MKVRIKFSKHGAMKFIGHLDILRYFQKAMRRSNIDIAYSGGFSPHQIMSFAAPLGVGLESNGEYMDIEINTLVFSKEALSRLNANMADGISVLSFRKLPDTAKNAMSIVSAADYTLCFREDYEPEFSWREQLVRFAEQSSIVIVKKTKRSETEVDIKPFIYELSLRGDSIFMKLATGSVNNLKPELVMRAFYQWMSYELPEFSLMVTREELYSDAADSSGQERRVTLEAMGENIGSED